MYLKSIEVQGFKSFANKIVFEFHNGITGIVGPNGSGKSNVADAVRWVLGEQRIKQLRGSSMQDVIFSGTETRKPQGFACVAITLDNSDHQLAIDYNQVTVSRRVYRSGESEYLINGSACRLKDIHELFYDTGIGKEGYSIIGQGQIDKILSGKPEDRRELFDEAAGIVKFKRRKAIAQKKLEDEKQNLVRVGDILSELEKQVGPLERQSKAAREYLRLKDELKTRDVNLFLMETESLKGQTGELDGKAQIVAGDLEEAKKALEESKAKYDALDACLAQLDQDITAARGDLSLANMEKGSLEGQVNVLKEQIHTEQINGEHINNRIQAIQGEMEGKAYQQAAYQEEGRALSLQAEQAQQRKDQAEEALMAQESQVESLSQSMESGKEKIISSLNEKASMAAKQQRYQTMLEQVDLRRSQVCQKLLKHKSDESAQDQLLALEEEKLGKAQEEITRLGKAQEKAGLQVENLEQEVRRLNKNLNGKQQEYHTSYTKLDSLRNIAERYEGYGNSIRKVMEVKDRIRGIHGVVADLVAVPKEYEVAMETALGGSIQNIVTDSGQTAKQLIEYLKKNKYGRATFLPLTSISSRSGFNQDKALQEPGVLGLAHELVKVEPQYEGLARYLLGRVVVVDGIDHAISLAKKYHYSLRIVTLEGELLSPGGSMAGGAFKNASNLLGRKREMEELEAACSKALAAVDRLGQELAASEGQLANGKLALEGIKADQQAAYIEQNTLEMNIAQIQEKKAQIQDACQDLVLENNQLEDQVKDIGDQLKGLKAEMGALEDHSLHASQDMEDLGEKLEEAKACREAKAKALEEARIEAAGLLQKLRFATENIHRVEEEANRLKEELKGLEGGTEASCQAIGEKEKEICEIRQKIEDQDLAIKQLEQAVAAQTGLKEEKAKEQKGFFQMREELSDRISRLDKEAFRLQSQREKLEERIEGLVNYMWNEYQLTYTTAGSLRSLEPLSLAQVRKEMEELKEAIRGLGNVNVNAIEDYKEVSARYEFLKTQHGDLVKAEETLLQVIDQLDQGMRLQFEEKFREIRQEFDKVFKELFGGGRGTLELVEDEDILEAGIQIISQPPGKKLQNMMQLSGGEKALTAIALLFAIQNLKPSPFCLLDEIEAALDDSNVDRFAHYLHKLTRNTQFIVITHRRGTMVSADRLYGITMQEKGVSTLVSVNLIEEDLEG